MKEGDLVAGRYRLRRPIGGGGMGVVWEARHELLGRLVAIKVASGPASQGAGARARFLREARIAGSLRHPNVVDVLDVGALEDDGGFYLVMELLEGESLAQRLARSGALPEGEALRVAIDLCRGLAAAHAAGVVHRDIKPANVFLARAHAGATVTKLLDFGISKTAMETGMAVTLPEQVLGTPAYMSPEQALGEADIDLRTDLWSVGVLLYEMLRGRPPFGAASYVALLPRIAEQPHEPLPDEVSPEIREIVNRCLAKSRDARPASADELRAALEGQLSRLPASSDAEGAEAGVASDDAARSSEGGFVHPPATGVRTRWLVLASALTIAAAGAAGYAARSPAPAASPGAPPARTAASSGHATGPASAPASRGDAPSTEAPPPVAPASLIQPSGASQPSSATPPAQSGAPAGPSAAQVGFGASAAAAGPPPPAGGTKARPVPSRPVTGINTAGF